MEAGEGRKALVVKKEEPHSSPYPMARMVARTEIEQPLVINEISLFKLLSHVHLFATPWTIALQAPLLMGFPRQEYWSGLPFPSPRDLPDPGIKPGSHALQTDLPSETPGFGTLNLVYS